jgi:hypothetical protein
MNICQVMKTSQQVTVNISPSAIRLLKYMEVNDTECSPRIMISVVKFLPKYMK